MTDTVMGWFPRIMECSLLRGKVITKARFVPAPSIVNGRNCGRWLLTAVTENSPAPSVASRTSGTTKGGPPTYTTWLGMGAIATPAASVLAATKIPKSKANHRNDGVERLRDMLDEVGNGVKLFVS